MAAQKESQIVVPFNEGVVEGLVPDVAQGAVVTSENTRLSVLMGTVTKAPLIETFENVGADAVCGGLFAGGRNSSVAYFKPEIGHKRIVGTEVEDVVSSTTSVTTGQNAYFPYQMTDAGAIGGSLVASQPATCIDSSGRTWFAAVRPYGAAGAGVYVSVLQDGEEVITTRLVRALTTALPYPLNLLFWCGVTVQNDGVCIWYTEDAGISRLLLSIDTDGLTLIAGSPVLVHVPYTTGLVLVYSDVASDGGDFGYLLTRATANANDAVLLKVNVNTGAVALTQPLVGYTSAANTAYFAVTYVDVYTVPYILVAVSESPNVWRAGVHSSALVNSWSTFTTTAYGRVSIQPWLVGGNAYVVCAVANEVATFPTSVSSVHFEMFDFGTGATVGTCDMPFYKLQSRGSYHKVSDAEIYPYFPLQAHWNNTGSTYVSDVDFVADPSIELFTPYQNSAAEPILTPVARYGVDKASRQSIASNSNASYIADGKFVGVYLEERFDQSLAASQGWAARYVSIHMAPTEQPRAASDQGGVSVIAAALPAIWDGAETTEYSPIHIPRISVSTTGGTGSALTGTYSFRAVVSWRDRAGNVRRSAPSNTFTVTLAATSPIVWVSRASSSMRSGARQEEFDITVYATLNGGAIFYAQPYVATSHNTNFCWRFPSVGAPSANDVELYSTGAGRTELLPISPPPMWDVAAVAGRLWAIDAENRYVVWPSKLKTPGIAYEFAGELIVDKFDEKYGKLVAIADLNGTPIVFAETGIWGVGSEGPNNVGEGTYFADPRLIASVGCKSRNSVVQIPAVGIMFQADAGRFALLGSGGLKLFEDVGTYDVGTPTVHRSESEVIYPLTDGSGFVVYNWRVGAWTHWTTGLNGEPLSCTLTLYSPERSRSLFYSPTNGALAVMDSDTTAEAEVRIARAWIAPEAPQGDCVIRQVFLQCLRGGVHGVSVTLSFDYNDSNTIVRTWTASEITALTVDGRYTIGVDCQAKDVRAVKIEISEDVPSETNSDGLQPLNATITYGASAGPRQRTMKAGALK